MNTFRLERHTLIPGPIEKVFPFFAEAGNLERITPPWLRFKVLTPGPIEMRQGALIDYSLRLRGIPIRWRTRIAAWDPPHLFIDEQVKGPYSLWRHTHSFEPDPAGSGGTRMRDEVDYAIPAGPLAPVVDRLYVRRDLERIFNYRSAAIGEHFRSNPAMS